MIDLFWLQFLTTSYLFYLFLPILYPLLSNTAPSNRWRKLWTRTGTYCRDIDTNKLQLPQLIKTAPTPNGQALTFRLPTGFSPSDLEKTIPAIEYEFNCSTTLDVHNKNITIYLNTNPLPTVLNYTPIPVSGTLPIYLGNSLTGPQKLDLATLPHLLIAGPTGTGKTTLLKLILSYLIQHTTAQLYTADMARTDLTFIEKYGGIFIPTASGLQIVINELHTELFTRLDTLAKHKCENLFELNKLIKNPSLPRIVLAIDELAIFRPKPGTDREEKQSILNTFAKLIDLASTGRKAGIHLILCTQQPNKDVIPALLRDNIPCRIAFKCVTRWQSDAILQSPSALYLPAAPGRCILQHGEEITIQVPDYNKATMTAELDAYSQKTSR